MDIIKSIEHEKIKNKIPDLKVGNTVKVHVRIKEGNKERIQVFEGIIIKVQGSGVNKTFTVRKNSYGEEKEKTFLIHSPLVEKVVLVRVGRARRAKLFYLRDRVGKSAKTREIVGARIENKEIEIKGLVEESQEPVVEETTTKEVPTEKKATEEVLENPVAEEVVEEVKKEEAKVVEEKAKKEETKVVEKAEKKSAEKETTNEASKETSKESNK